MTVNVITLLHNLKYYIWFIENHLTLRSFMLKQPLVILADLIMSLKRVNILKQQLNFYNRSPNDFCMFISGKSQR